MKRIVIAALLIMLVIAPNAVSAHHGLPSCVSHAGAPLLMQILERTGDGEQRLTCVYPIPSWSQSIYSYKKFCVMSNRLLPLIKARVKPNRVRCVYEAIPPIVHS